LLVATPIRESISSAAEKIQGILEAAEEAARAIQAEAEADAARYREERRREADALVGERADRLKELAASLGDHAVQVRAAVLSLSAELDRAADELRGESEPPAQPSESEEEEGSPEGPDRARPGWFRRRGPVGATSGAQTPRPVAYDGITDAAPAGDAPPAAGGPADALVPDEALLRATQMAVAGRSREEIEEALRRDFAVANPAAVVDDISRPRRGGLRG
jgi:hypothetical protein